MNVSVFPLPLQYHLILAIIGCIFFLTQFIRLKKPHQIIMAIAMPASLLIYIAPENDVLFYGIGIFECIAFVAAILLSCIASIQKKTKNKKQEVPTA